MPVGQVKIGETEMKRLILAALVGALVSGAAAPALADHCPLDLVGVYVALEKASDNSDYSVAKVMSLADLGYEFHKLGNHDAAIEAIHRAMQIPGISHK